MNLKTIIITTIVVLLMCGTALAATYTVGSSGCDYTTIQAAVTAASEYDTVYVYNGTYNENVDITTAHLTLEGEGRDVVTVTAASSANHVFNVTADYVNISGFTATGAIETGNAGIHLFDADHCHIDNNNASSNCYGIHLYSSSNCTLTNNTANSNNHYGICLYFSSNNMITNNTANSNNYNGIYLCSSSNNMITNNTASNDHNGICIGSSSNYNTFTSNTASNNYYGIYLSSSSNNNLTSNTANSNNNNGIHLDSSSNNMLTGNNASSNNYYGIYLSSSSNNNLTSNTANSNDNNGIHLQSSSNNNTLTENTASSNNYYGIYLSSSSNNMLTGNNASSNNHYGIYLSSSSNNNLTSNTANSNNWDGTHLGSSSNNNTLTNNTANSNNHYGICLYDSSGNMFTSNVELNNIKAHSYLQTDAQEGSVGNQIDFNFTMKTIDNIDCTACVYEIILSPLESNIQHSKSGALVTGSFTPTRKGIYSMRINVTDSDGNSEIRKYVYLIDATSSSTIDYYFRHVLATHGQSTNYGSDHDAGSLLFDPPISDEFVWCGEYVGLSIDELPIYLFGSLKKINYSIWYKTDSGGYTGVQRYNDVTTDVDKSIDIVATAKTFDTFDFSVDWANDYSTTWYYITVKLKGSYPYIYSNATHPSYANITYNYSTTPALKSISNEDIQLLSATSPASDDTSASIVLGGAGSTYLVVQMPNTALTYTATWDGGTCTGGDCSFTQSAGELNFTLTLGSEHTIDISEAGGSTNTIVLGANKYGMLRKSVTSAQSFSTIAGEFSHDVCFTWWDSTNDRWESYYSGDSYNSAKSVPEHDSYFVLMDGTGETISCSVAPVENVDIPIGWSSTYLRESASKTLSEIKTDMGSNCADIYAWDSTASGTGAWTNTGTFSVLPNQGILVDASNGFTWDGSVS